MNDELEPFEEWQNSMDSTGNDLNARNIQWMYNKGEVWDPQTDSWRELTRSERNRLERLHIESQLLRQRLEWEASQKDKRMTKPPVVQQVKEQLPKLAMVVFENGLVMEFKFPDGEHPKMLEYGPFKLEHVGRDQHGRSMYVEVGCEST